MSLEQINRLLASGAYQPVLSTLKGFRNGAVYGAKVRFPHSLVMTLLFKRDRFLSKLKNSFLKVWEIIRNDSETGVWFQKKNEKKHLISVKDMAKGIAEATFTHSKNLAFFVFAYKSLTNLMSWTQSDKHQYQSFVAAFCAGYFIFGKYNKVNEQINLYLLSRILYGLAKLAVKRGYISKPKQDTFPWFAAIVWGIVLWMFEYEGDTLQPSLKSSMTYLYHDSNIWHSIRDFLLYNK